MAKALENPCSKESVPSFREAKPGYVLPFVSELGIDFVTDDDQVLFHGEFGQALEFSRSAVPPVGLVGKLSMRTLQPGCQACSKASGSRAKEFSGEVATGIASPKAKVTLGA